MSGKPAAKWPAKLGTVGGPVNSARVWIVCRATVVWTTVLLALSGCSFTRIVPPLPPDAAGAQTAIRYGAEYADESVPQEPAVAWRKDTGRGLTRPVVVDEPIVIATTTSRTIVTISAETGKHYWTARFRGALTSAPRRLENRVFAASSGREERVYALDLARGRRLWSRRVGVVLVDPLVVDSTLYTANEAGVVIALDARTGAELWRSAVGAAPAIAPIGHRGHLFLATRRDTLYRVVRETGQVIDRIALQATPSAPPALHNDLLILPLHSGELVAISLSDMREVWRADLHAAILAGPAVTAEGDVYAVTCSAEVWRTGSDAGALVRIAELDGAVAGSFTLTRDGLIVGRLDGALFHLGFDGRIIWKLDLEDSIMAPVAARAGALYVPLLRGDLVKLQ